MKKICIITRSMSAGGAERVIAQLLNYFAGKGMACTLITLEQGESWYPLDSTVEYLTIGRQSDNRLIDRVKTCRRVRRLVKEIKPDAVLSLPEEVGAYVLLALLGTGIPVFVSERNNPWVMPDVKITRLLRRLMYPFAAGLIFQTEMARSFFPRRIREKGIVIPNPVDSCRIPEPWKGQREKTVAGVGRLEPQKNFSLLLQAFADFHAANPDYRLVIYGEGSERKLLEGMLADYGLMEAVSLPGRKENVLELLNHTAMFVLSSDYEGMPNALLEAMCMGMPVIATDCPSGGPRELIENGKNGLLIPVGDKQALTAAMERMTDPLFAAELGSQAYGLKDDLCSDRVFQTWEAFLLNQTE